MLDLHQVNLSTLRPPYCSLAGLVTAQSELPKYGPWASAINVKQSNAKTLAKALLIFKYKDFT